MKIINIIYTQKHPALAALSRTRRGIADSPAEAGQAIRPLKN